MKYVALLRGINVGGNNKVSMKQLVTALEQAGFSDVSTYINSGNIFFSDTNKNLATLRSEIEAIIASEFNLNIKALVLNKPAIDSIVAKIPPDWTNNTAMKCDVLFLWENYRSDEVIQQLPLRTGIDAVKHTEGAIIWGVPRDKITKSGMPKIVGTEMYAHMTIRNYNTTRKIQQIMSGA
jgi:uncharacterized protein (DUF1697 family)